MVQYKKPGSPTFVSRNNKPINKDKVWKLKCFVFSVRKLRKVQVVQSKAFAEKMMGDGAVVTPEDPYVRAPEDGEVAFVFDTKHAIGFVTDSGVSLLIHVGIDTVKLNGEGFEALVESGQTVKKGDPMLKLDLEYLKTHAPSVTSPVLCTELEENQRIRLLADGPVKAGDPLFAIEILA